jgi:nucleotide sugar dehydrogenase
MTKVVVVGQGYVGLPVAVRAAEVGFDVVGLDLDVSRIERLAKGDSFVEDITHDRLVAALDSGRYQPSSDPDDAKGFDVAVISVPTPLREGIPDLSYIESAAASLADHLRPGATVVLESTTYPGTTEELVQPILEGATGLAVGTDFFLGYSPERIDPGNPTYRLENTPKVVSGVTAACLEKVRGFFDQLVEETVPVSSPKEAELAKLLENTFRHVNIALVNELAIFANELGVNAWEAIDAANTKPFGFRKFTPGPGVGGHCLPIDPSYLSWQVRRTLGHTFRFVELANDVNEHMPDHVVSRVVASLNRDRKAVNGARLVMLGLSYKKNTGDPREAPSRHIVRRLLGLGAEITAIDPHIDPAHAPDGVRLADFTADELAAADLVLLVVDHDVFDADTVVDNSVRVLDCRNVLRGPNVETL